MSEHLDLDTLADVLAGRDADGSPSPQVEAHLEACAGCRAEVDALAAAIGRVDAVLASLPVPELPAELAGRLDAAVARERRALTAGTAATVTPLAPRRSAARWLPIAGGVAAAAVLVLGGIVLFNDNPKHGATGAAGARAVASSSTGTVYGKDGKALAAELPALLKGNAPATEGARAVAPAGPQAVQQSPGKQADTSGLAATADALAPLRTTAGLASCLVGLTDPASPGLPLALDYAAFEGEPALVVVLPSSKAKKVDVFVVGPACSAKDAKVLFFARLDQP